MQDVRVNFEWLPCNCRHPCLVHTTPEKFEKDVSHSKNTSNVFRPHFVENAKFNLYFRKSSRHHFGKVPL